MPPAELDGFPAYEYPAGSLLVRIHQSDHDPSWFAAIHSTEDYDLTQAWAVALLAAGFEGIRYLVSHDPSQRLVGVAVFGQGALEFGEPEPIGAETIAAAEAEFNIRVRPTP